ncbi:MAG: ABC transporter permease [Clostridia bacterium]|nr:ABC transporter permease [Clostridia bacterium]
MQSIKMALKAIGGNKMRSFLTILGVIIGVVAIVVLVAIAQGAQTTVISSIENMGTDLLSVTIRARRSNPVSLDGLNKLSEDISIAYVAPYTTVSGTVKAGATTYDDARIIATSPGYDEIRNLTLASGRWITAPDMDNRSFVAILGSEAADEMFGTQDVVGEIFSINGYSFQCVGVLESNGSSAAGSQDNLIVIPFTLGQRLTNSTKITSFYVSAVSSDEIGFAQAAIENYLNSIFSSTSYYSVYNQTEILSTLNEAAQSLTLMMGGIAAISLLVGGIGIMNIMLVSVSERTREIGIRKAIGANRGSILRQFLIEALVVSVMGGILGLLIAWGSLIFLEPVLNMTLTVSPTVAGAAIAFSMFIGVVFGIYPASKASKLKPIDALHYEG